MKRLRLVAAVLLAAAVGAAKAADADPAAWPAGILDWRTSPVDLSFLNKPEIPAGRRGFLRARGERLLFEDGTPARFWGTSLTAAALFGSSKEAACRQARRISQLGFNLVRLHHHDSPWVNPNIFGEAGGASTRSLSEPMLDRLDWLIKCLKDEGIYVWLDLHAQRFLKPGDGIRDFAEIAKGKANADLKGYSYVNPTIQQAMKDFAEAFLTRRNRYTGVRLADEPAVVAILVSNENDLTGHYGNALLPDKGVPAHNAAYMDLAARFAADRGLPADATWRAWEPGPGKLFLNDLEYRVNADFVAHLRSLGVRVPVATTQTWAANPLSSLPALTAGDLIDVHSYGGAGEIGKNPVTTPGFLHWMAAAQVAGRPLSVSEWNLEPFPLADRHAALLYAYSQAPLDSAAWPSNWHAFNDPALIGTLPAAALLYRQAHVRESALTYAFAPSAQQLLGQAISPATSPALRTAAEIGKLVIVMPPVRELPWLEAGAVPAGARLITDPGQSLLPAGAGEAVSDTGELRRDWESGVFAVATARTQAAAGRLGGRSLELPDVSLALTTPGASVAVQSLDGKPIRQSRNLMISLAARALPQTPKSLPFRAEPVEGRISVAAPAGLRLYAATADGRTRPVAASYEAGRYTFAAERSLQSYWLFLR